MLETDGNNRPVQAFVCSSGNMNKTTGDVIDTHLVIHCSIAGTLSITFSDDSTEDLLCNVGEDWMFRDATSISVTDGTFQVMV